MKKVVTISTETLNGVMSLLSSMEGININPLVEDFYFSNGETQEDDEAQKNLLRLNITLLLNGVKTRVPAQPLYDRTCNGYYEYHILHYSMLRDLYTAETTYYQFDDGVFVKKSTCIRTFSSEELEFMIEDKNEVISKFTDKSTE